MQNRIRVALQSPDGWRRLAHFVGGKGLFALPASVRRDLFAGDAYHCPLCQSDLRTFLTLYRPYHRWCPVCRSLQRHRFLWLFFTRSSAVNLASTRRLLHFAPEPCLADQFRRLPALDYVSVDLHDPTAMVKMDITQLTFPDASFDLILCSHVLEHVPDDRAALRELFRVLMPGGHAILLVPQREGPTDEDPTITDPIVRERRFGQLDHVRFYGSDFVQRVEATGFLVAEVSTTDIATPDEHHLMGMIEDEKLFLATKPSLPLT